MPSPQPNQIANRSNWTVEREGREALFRKARRHSRIVRALQIILPALVVLTTAGITISTYLSPLLTPPPANVAGVVVSGTKVTMDHPSMRGFTRGGRAYELQAKTATQDITKPDLIDLHKIDAKLEMQDHSTVQLTSPRGNYNSKAEKLKLGQNVLITSSDGYQGRLKEARVNIKTGRVISDQPVEIKMLKGTLNANRMEIISSGDLIRFDHGVQLTMFLKPAETRPKVARAGNDGGGRTNAAAGNASSEKATRLTLTRLPHPDPRRILASRATQKRRAPIRLRP